MVYHDLVLSGKTTSKTIFSGDSAYNTLVRNGAKLRISAGGYVESTTVMNSTTVSNAGSAVSTFLSGGTMLLSAGAVADTVSVLRNARLTVSAGAVATGLYVSSGNVNTTVTGGDETTLVTGVNEKGDFFLSGGVASNFLMNSLGQLTVSSGGTAMDTTIRFGGYLTVMSGGVATGIEQSAGGYVRADVYGADPNTVARGVNASGEFSLSGGVASNFILYDGGAQQVFSGGTAFHTLVSGQRAFQYVWSGGVASNTSIFKNGIANIYEGGIARDVMIAGGGSMVTNDGAVVSGATVHGVLQIDSGTGGEGESGGIAKVGDVTVLSGGTLAVNRKANFFGDIDILGELKIAQGITVSSLAVSSGGSAQVSGTFNLAAGSSWNTRVAKNGTVNVSSGATLFNLAVVSGGRVNVAAGAVLAGTDIDLAENTIYYNGSALGMTASGGVITNLGADGKTYYLTFGSGVAVAGAAVGKNGQLRVLSGAAASGTVIGSGGVMTVSSAAVATDTTVATGGTLILTPGAELGKHLFLDFSDSPSGGAVPEMVNDLSLVGSGTAICLTGTSNGGVYTVTSEGSSELYVHCMPTLSYDTAIKAGESVVNAFIGMKHIFDAEGKTIAAVSSAVAEFSSAAALDDSTVWMDGDRAAVWTDFSVSSGAVLNLVSSSFGGDAWLEISGTDLSETTLYGASAGVNFGGTVNMYAAGGAAIGNLAAGAGVQGTVDAVKLTLEDAAVGLAYAGGFGNVTGKTESFIASGATVLKDFYAGALANYAKTHTATSTGDIALEITAGEFSGNIYGAASVKAGTITTATTVHTVDDVSLTLAGGTADKGTQACVFAGGYATGHDTAKALPVYTVESVTVNVMGGEWGSACGGRGIFGGAMASDNTANGNDGIYAKVGAVNISISGGTMGNVYGGGWAQKGALSEVGDVSITISGGTIANVFGGGSTSTSGGSTVAGDVTITVAGGTISGDIYARGQSATDVVNSAEVIFTGANDFACGVYGYSYVGEDPASDATLAFNDYTGTFSGKLGGFADVTVGGNSWMTLGTAAADVVNGAWIFDVADRDAGLTGTALLNWTAAEFTDDTITLNLASGDSNAWSLVSAASTTVYNQFDVLVDGTSILSETIALDDPIASGDYQGWGFTLEDSVLKFKILAS